MFRVTRYPLITKTESGRVGYRKKYRVAGRVRVPAGHCLGVVKHLRGRFVHVFNLTWQLKKNRCFFGASLTRMEECRPCVLVSIVMASIRRRKIGAEKIEIRCSCDREGGGVLKSYLGNAQKTRTIKKGFP